MQINDMRTYTHSKLHKKFHIVQTFIHCLKKLSKFKSTNIKKQKQKIKEKTTKQKKQRNSTPVSLHSTFSKDGEFLTSIAVYFRSLCFIVQPNTYLFVCSRVCSFSFLFSRLFAFMPFVYLVLSFAAIKVT